MLIDTDARSLHLYSLEHCVGSIDGRLALLIVLGDSLLDGTIKLQLVRPGLAVDDLKLTTGRVNHVPTRGKEGIALIGQRHLILVIGSTFS